MTLNHKLNICRFTAIFLSAIMMVSVLVFGTHSFEKNAYAEFTDLEKYYIDQVAALTNIEREKQGLEPLKVYPLLCEAATQRSKETVELFEHTRPDGSSCVTVLSDYSIPFYAFGENIASGFPTPESVINGWMNSDGHRANILGADYTHIGIGYYKSGNVIYWTQLFLKPTSSLSGTYIPEYKNPSTATTTTTTKKTTTTTTTVSTTTTPQITTTSTTTTTMPISFTSSQTTTTTTTSATTTTTLFAPPSISINTSVGIGEDMYFADDTTPLLSNSTFEIVVKKPISKFVYSNFYFDLSSVVTLDNVNAYVDSAEGISPCDIYYSIAQSNEYSINFAIDGISPEELALIISETVEIDLETIKDAMTGKIVDDNFEYLDTVFGKFETAIALRGDVDLNGACDANDAIIIADYESAYSKALAESAIFGTEFVAPELYSSGNDSQTLADLRKFAANINSDKDESGTARIDTLDAAYIKMFSDEYKTICDELETNGQQLDVTQTVSMVWQNLGIIQ